MNYFKLTENELIRYEVIFNRHELEQLKSQIISDCSIIVHRKYVGICAPNPSNPRIKNFDSKIVGLGGTDGKEIQYLFSYNEYLPPYLDLLIDGLLAGYGEVIDDIINPKYELERPSIEEMINKVSLELCSINDTDIKAKTEKLRELAELTNLKELNKNQIPVDRYYKKLQQMIYLKKIGKLPINNSKSKPNPPYDENKQKVKIRLYEEKYTKM